jgi:3-phosphoshikimate 1-carboxyvinyltransferase
VDGYIDITIDILKKFGITINRVVDGYDIPGRQIYNTPGEIRVERDWSLSALWLTSGALSQKNGGSIACTELPSDSQQGYRNLSGMLSQLVTDFQEIYVDAQDCAALVPLISLVAAAGLGSVHISGVPQLHHKESDRIKTMATLIRQMGGSVTEKKDGLIAKGNGGMAYPENFFIDCKEDPNILISFALAASVLEKPFLIDETVINKSWPDFFKIYKSLGGKYEIVKNSIDTETSKDI